MLQPRVMRPPFAYNGDAEGGNDLDVGRRYALRWGLQRVSLR